jgi:hypothetical protein
MQRYLLLALLAMAPRPTLEDQRRTLNAARELAIHYSSKLPDFICTELVQRTDRTINTTIMKSDRLTIQLSFSGQQEKQKLVAVDGKSTSQPLESLDGLITGGEFGVLLLSVFDPSSSADFEWKKPANLRNRPAAVYSYRISRAKSHYLLGQRQTSGNLAASAAGFHGEVTLDTDTAKVLRLTAIADDIPKDSGILQSSVEVDYDFLEVAGHSYLLPSRSESRMERGYRQIGSAATFTGYRKFEVDAAIDFKP